MRATLPLSLALAVASFPVAAASCAGSTSTTLCFETIDGEPDAVVVTLSQSYAPVGWTYACATSGAGADVGLIAVGADGFAAACLAHYDGYSGNTYLCVSAIAIDDVHVGCALVANDNGVLGPTNAGADGGIFCVEVSGVRDCILLP